jgi:hypothetical protein
MRASISWTGLATVCNFGSGYRRMSNFAMLGLL